MILLLLGLALTAESSLTPCVTAPMNPDLPELSPDIPNQKSVSAVNCKQIDNLIRHQLQEDI